jgi:hypothetical protein
MNMTEFLEWVNRINKASSNLQNKLKLAKDTDCQLTNGEFNKRIKLLDLNESDEEELKFLTDTYFEALN